MNQLATEERPTERAVSPAPSASIPFSAVHVVFSFPVMLMAWI